MSPTFRHWFQWLTGLAGWASLILLLGFMTANAEVQCHPYDDFVDMLGSPSWSEIGWAEFTVTDQNIPGQCFKSTRGTFTCIVIPKPGVACVVLSGQDLGPMQPSLPTKPKEIIP